MAAVVDDVSRFVIGAWVVDLSTRQLKRDGRSVTLEPLQMAVLAALCRQPGEVISTEALLDACWHGEATGDNPLHKVVTALRRTLGDDAADPQYIETLRKRGYRLVAPVKRLTHDGERSLQGGWRGKSPFRGLQAFEASHASVFFGRDAEVAALRQRLGEQWQRGETLVVLLGPSGSGKTSLVQAGLIPAMSPRADAAPASSVQGSSPLQVCAAACVDLGANELLGPWDALAGGLLDWEIDNEPLLSGYSIESLAAALRADPGRVLHALEVGLNARRVQARLTPPLLVLDRFEALLQPTATAERAGVMACLAQLAQRHLMLMLVVSRNDFYAEIARMPLLMQGKPQGAHLDLAPPSASAIAQMIRLPARAAGLRFGSDPSGIQRLDDRLCVDAVRAPDALPLLQYTLQALYQARAAGEELSWQAYEELGGLEGAIGRRAEAVIDSLPKPQQEALPALLSRLVAVATEDAPPTGRWADLGSIANADERALVQALVEARLLVSDHVGGIAGVRVAHEAMLRCWPRVTGWVTQHRAMLAVRDELAPWTRRWHEGQGAASLLLPRGPLLWRAASALNEAAALFDERDRHYVQRSLTRLRRQTQWRWTAGIATGVLAIAAIGVAARNAQLVRIASERQQQSQRLSSFMLGDLADQLRPIGKLDLLDSIGQQGVELLGNTTAVGESPEDALQRVKALTVIGEVNSTRGKNKVGLALDALNRADNLLDAILQQPGAIPVTQLDKARGTLTFWLGQIAFDAGNFDEAARQMNRYRGTSEHWLSVAPGDAEATSELGYAVGSLGAIAIRQGAWAEAQRWYEESLRMKSAALGQRPNDLELIDSTASVRGWLGQLAYTRGDFRNALTFYEQAREARKKLLERDPTQKVRLQKLAVVEQRRAETLGALGRHGEAVNGIDEASRRYTEAVAHDPRNPRWRLEALHVESTRLLLRAVADMPITTSLASLRHQLHTEIENQLHGDLMWREAQLQLSVAEAWAAVRQEQWNAFDKVASAADSDAQQLLSQRSQNGLAWELRARLTLLRLAFLQAHASDLEMSQGEPTPYCLQTAASLAPGVRAGHNGLVLEAWLLARNCAERKSPGSVDEPRLTEGGYQRQFPLFRFSQLKEKHGLHQ